MPFTFEQVSNGGLWEPALVGSLFSDRGLCGTSANRGLLRFHDATSGPTGQAFVSSAFGPRGVSVDVFAFDWLARQFAVTTEITADGQVVESGERVVVVLDPFDMSITPWASIDEFEHALGTPLASQFLRPKFFEAWRHGNGVHSLEFDRCAGATVPGFYRGDRTVDNLDHNFITVYLSFIEQLWQRAITEAAGTPARPVSIRRDQE